MLTLPCDMTACPPNTDDMSITLTFAPPRPRSSAADNPEMPAPTTITSESCPDGAEGERPYVCSRGASSDRPVLAETLSGVAGEQPPSQRHASSDTMASAFPRDIAVIWLMP